MTRSSIVKILSTIVVALLFAFLLSKAQSIDSGKHDRYHADLLQLKESDASLDDTILRTRYRLLASYDPLNVELAKIRNLQESVKNPPAYINRQGRTEMSAEWDEFSKAISLEDGLIQRFKSQNAILNNSLRYFPVATKNLADKIESASGAGDLVSGLNVLLADCLRYSLSPNQDLAHVIEDQIDRISHAPGSGDSATHEQLLSIFSHAKTILEQQPAIDQLTKDLIEVPTQQHAEKLYNSYTQHYDVALQSSHFYRLCLYVLSVGLLCLVILKLRTAAQELKAIKGSLERREAQLVEAQHIAHLGSSHFDVATGQMQWSENMWHIYGIAPREIGLPITEYLERVHVDDRDMVRNQMEETVREGTFKPIHHRIVWPDGTVRVIASDGKVIFGDKGQVVAVAGINQDITREKEMEEEIKKARDSALDSARLKSEFLANMSHEIRTPMNGVIGMTGILLNTELNAEQRDFAETIRSSAESLMTIINDILDFSKIEAGKLNFEILDFDLRGTVEDSVELLAEKAHSKGIELVSLVPGGFPTALRGDAGRLRQVLTNLLGNAVKFTDHGEVIVQVEKDAETESSVMVRFSVSDTGIGITQEAQQNLFQAFTQADGSTTRKYGGTGLGLTISRQLVGLMGGQIGITSIIGSGSTFWFTALFEKQPLASQTAILVKGSLENLRVLIVDDNQTNRRILCHQSRYWGMIPTDCDSGKRALEILRVAAAAGAPYQLGILDLMMPEMDGFELARTIKADSDIARMPLVMLTSFRERNHTTAAREAGIAAYLTKPVRQSQLLDCLTNVMGQALSDPANVAAALPLTLASGQTSTMVLTEGKPTRNKLILLAEDNIVNQKVAIRQLKQLGLRADAVNNGREALEALARIPYDLIFMDCQMPEMDGYEATAEIRRREGTTKHTPIVAMTAHALAGDRANCLAAGMDDYISKPVKSGELERVLERLLFSQETAAADETIAEEILPPPVDRERVYEALGDDPRDLLCLYLSDMDSNFEKLATAIETGKANEINSIAHNCAGVSATCGITTLVAPLRELERLGRENDLESAAALSLKTRATFERVKQFLQEEDYLSRPVEAEQLEPVLEKRLFDHEPMAMVDALTEETLPVPVDRERVHEALGEDPRDLIFLYVSDMDRNLEKLASAIEAEQADEINTIAHNCAGVSATCGIIAMVAPLRELERMGRENDLEGAVALVRRTRATFERVEQFLQEEYISKPPKSEEPEPMPEKRLFAHEPMVIVDAAAEETVPPPVDREQVYEALGEDPSDLICLYLSDMDRNLEKLASAIEAAQADEVNSIAHNCAGVSATCGVIAMVAPLRELERMGRENDLEGAAALGLETRVTFERVKQFLQKEFEGVVVAV